jgi:uncharacterized protein YndB with AHSA1/START domain
MNTTISPTKQNTFELTVSRVFDAPRELVWRAWTDPEQFKKWMIPGEGAQVLAATKDLRVGGKYSIEFKKPDGMRKVVTGVYREVVAPERLAFTWGGASAGADASACGGEPNETLVTLEFRAQGKRTELVLKHEGFSSTEARDGHNNGWTCGLEHLASFLKSA